MNTAARLIIGLLLLSILVAGGFMLLRGGVYGLTIFVVAPVALGAIAAAVALCALLVVGLEGVYQPCGAECQLPLHSSEPALHL